MQELRLDTELTKIVIRNSRLQVKSVADGDRLAADLGYDSLAFLTLLGDLETAFQVQFPLEKIGELQDLSFGELKQLVSK